jgi:acyl-CoA synthetase (NDP forming)
VPQLAPETERRLREILPSFAGFRNPIDITMAQIINQDLSRQCIKIVADDPNIDVIITVLAAGDPAVLIKTALSAKAETSKPLLALTNEPAEASRPIRLELEKAGIPVYEHPERIAQALAVALRKTMLS